MAKGRKRKVRERAEKNKHKQYTKNESEHKEEIKNGRLWVGPEGRRKRKKEWKP